MPSRSSAVPMLTWLLALRACVDYRQQELATGVPSAPSEKSEALAAQREQIMSPPLRCATACPALREVQSLAAI